MSSMRGIGDRLLHINLRDLYRSDACPHILVVGMTGSGKTATLLKVAYNCFKANDLLIWRDDANLEFLSFIGVVPLKIFLPEGCSFRYLHPDMEFVHYDHRDLTVKIGEEPGIETGTENYVSMFDLFDRDSLNVILFDIFTTSLGTMVSFWRRFFREIYRFKRVRIREKWTLVFDELNDLCPGKGRGFIQGQMRLSNDIYVSMKKFRKMKLRLVGSTHGFNDIHVPVRSQFQYYFLKKMRRFVVPSFLWSFRYRIEKMPVNRLWIADPDGFFQANLKWSQETNWHVDPTQKIRLKPKQAGVQAEGEIPDEAQSGRKMAEKWRDRALRTAYLLRENGIIENYRELATLWDVHESYGWKLYDRLDALKKQMFSAPDS